MEIRKETYILAAILMGVFLFWQKEKIVEVAGKIKSFSGSRGIRNNNPGNIRKSSDKWQGLSKVQPDSAFFSFDTPEYGIRALVKVLKRYKASYGLNTIRGIITRWAPPSENNTASYIAAVSKDVGISADTEIVFTRDILKLVKAIIEHENGTNPYTDETIAMGIGLAA